MRWNTMFITAVCVIFLIKLRWPKNKSLNIVQKATVTSPVFTVPVLAMYYVLRGGGGQMYTSYFPPPPTYPKPLQASLNATQSDKVFLLLLFYYYCYHHYLKEYFKVNYGYKKCPPLDYILRFVSIALRRSHWFYKKCVGIKCLSPLFVLFS